MNDPAWNEDDTREAKRIWIEYQREHDLADQTGRTVGIDATSGRLWFGDSIADVVAQRDADGIDALLYFVRVGSEAYLRKGVRIG